MSEHRVLVCGGRAYEDVARLYNVLDGLDRLRPIGRLAHGGAKTERERRGYKYFVGADYLSGQWAKSRGIACDEYPADWKTHGRAAGPIRTRYYTCRTEHHW